MIDYSKKQIQRKQAIDYFKKYVKYYCYKYDIIPEFICDIIIIITGYILYLYVYQLHVKYAGVALMACGVARLCLTILIFIFKYIVDLFLHIKHTKKETK